MAKHIKRESRAPQDADESSARDLPELEDILDEFGGLDEADAVTEDAFPEDAVLEGLDAVLDGADEILDDAEPLPENPGEDADAPEDAEKLPDAFPFDDEELSSFFTGEDGAPAAEDIPAAPVVLAAPAAEADAAPAAEKPESAPVKRPAPRKKPSGKSKKKRSSGGKRRGRSRRKKKNRFKTGLIVYLVIWGLVIVGLLATLWIGLQRSQERIDAENAELERQRAEQAAQKARERAVYRAPQLAFEDWLAGTDADYWTDLWYKDKTADLDGRDRVKEHLAGLFDAAEPFKSLDYTTETPVYVLKDGDTTLARITLSGSETEWSVSDVQLLVEGREKASVRVASGSRVYCNGVALGPDYIVDSSSYFTYDPLREQLVNPVTWDTYEVSGLLTEPEMKADPPEGGIVTETSEGDFLLCLDADAAKPYQTRAVNFVKSYLYYYMSGLNGTWGNLYAALAYLTPGYQAYKDLQDTYNGVVWNTAYGNIDTSKTTAGDVVIWADNCYSVDITYDADCTLNGQHIDYADATMRIYFLKTNAGYIISNFETL